MTEVGSPSASVDTTRVFEFLEETERTLPVDEWMLDGLRVWPLLRNYHAFGLITQHEYDRNSQIVRYAGGWDRVRQVVGAMAAGVVARARDAQSNHAASAPADVAFLIASTTRFFKIDGRWYSPYCDSFRPLLENRRFRMSVYEVTADGAYRVPRYAPSALVQNAVFFRSVLAKIRSRRPPKSECLEGWDEMLRISDRILGPGHSYPRSAIRFRAAQVQGIRVLFRRMLQASRPAVALFTGYYSAETMAFILACRDLGIRSVDVQHGVQGEWHFAYARWCRVPKGGYELLPDLFWTWDEAARDVINDWAEGTGGAHSAFCGGNPCLVLPESVETPLAAVGTVRVLFTAQAFFGLPTSITDAMALSPSHWHWWIRVHPQYWETRQPLRAELERRGLRNWSIDDASDAPMATVLAASDVHVTEFSSSVLEAEALGIPSVLVHPKGPNLFEPQMATGMALYAEDGRAVIDAIGRQVERRCRMRTVTADPVAQFAAGCNRLMDVVGEVRGPAKRARP